MKKKKRTIDELTRLAFIHAEQDVRGLVEACRYSPQEAASHIELADELHRYRIKRWGPTSFETVIANAKLVPLDSIMPSPEEE